MNENARILLDPPDSLLVPIDPSDVYYLEAVGGGVGLIYHRPALSPRRFTPTGRIRLVVWEIPG